MKFFDPNNPNEKKKMIAAAALGLVAIIVLGYVFFGGGSSKTPANVNGVARTSPTPRTITTTVGAETVDPGPNDCPYCKEIVYNGTVPAVSEANRNIFAYYIPPSPTPKQVYVP